MKRKKYIFSEIVKHVIDNPGSAFFYSPPIYKKEKCYIFSKPVKIVNAVDKDSFNNSLKVLSELKDDIAFGFISYEAAYLIEKKLAGLITEKDIFSKFLIFDKEQVQIFPSIQLVHDFNKEWESYQIQNLTLNKSKEEYKKSIREIKEYISVGDTYQVNFTIKGSFDFKGDLFSLFKTLIFNQSARYISLINDDGNFIVSISPELFFRIKGREITASPMKGTIKRGMNLIDDEGKCLCLRNSEKDKAENVMIVDLLRNDIGRVSEFGKVRVSDLFEVEKYESVYQMTSTIKAKLKKEYLFSDVIENIFPCGSITGAPKLRTMEIIKELEADKRGVYTGALGIVEQGKGTFNVPIRTLSINKYGKAEFGIGSGIVWDSDPESEYNETLLKGNFLINPDNYFEIFTTILVENGEPFLLDKHINRLEKTSQFFLFVFIKNRVIAKIKSICKKTKPYKKYRLKVIVNKWGEIKTEISELDISTEYAHIVVSKNTSQVNKFMFFKTTERSFYEKEFLAASEKGFDEVIFQNQSGFITEGSRTNIFIRNGDEWLTPPVSDGLLAGIYREYFLETTRNCFERSITLNDVKGADEVILVNALRKVIRAEIN